MEKIYSVEEIQTIEKKEFKKLKSSYVLMKRAGTNCAKKIYKSNMNRNFIVLCGPGNNGGDGLVISQALKKLNQNVILYCLEFITYKGDAKIAYKKNLGLFFENQAVSLFLLYGPLTSCKKSEKTNEPILRKVRY